MGLTGSRAALLHVAMQDLRAGKVLLVERLPEIRDAIGDEKLRLFVAREIDVARAQRERLDRLGDVSDGPSNLWMAGILDDADRDARSHQPGMIRDVALIGALRKAKAAEIVSSETALALARTEAPVLLASLQANHAEERATDAALRERLAALTACAD